MDLLRDLIRDLIGIIFPGSLVVLLGIWFTYGLYGLIYPNFGLLTILGGINSLTIGFILLVLSYVAGQFLRTYRPGNVESNSLKIDEELRKSIENSNAFSNRENKKEIVNFKWIKEQIDQPNLEEMSLLYKGIRDTESFPYPYRQKSRRLQGYPADFNNFYDKIAEKEILQKTTFFEFCKSVIYEYSPALKEEMLRETALVRLFTGLYYVSRLGLLIVSILIVAHIISLLHQFKSLGRIVGYLFKNPTKLEPSVIIILLSLIIAAAMFYAKWRIPKSIKRIRQRETNIVYDGFYLLCQRHQALNEAFDKRLNT